MLWDDPVLLINHWGKYLCTNPQEQQAAGQGLATARSATTQASGWPSCQAEGACQGSIPPYIFGSFLEDPSGQCYLVLGATMRTRHHKAPRLFQTEIGKLELNQKVVVPKIVIQFAIKEKFKWRPKWCKGQTKTRAVPPQFRKKSPAQNTVNPLVTTKHTQVLRSGPIVFCPERSRITEYV